MTKHVCKFKHVGHFGGWGHPVTVFYRCTCGVTKERPGSAALTECLREDEVELTLLHRVYHDFVNRFGNSTEGWKLQGHPLMAAVSEWVESWPDDVRLTNIADTLGFVIIPYDYLDQRSFEHESAEMQHAITEFEYEMPAGFVPWVLCPVAYYDVEQHVVADEESETATARARINEMQSRLLRLEETVAALVRIEIERKQAEQAAEAERRRWRAWEPLLFAIPKEAAPTSPNVTAFVGPCWGPDFPDIALTALGLAKRANQREWLAGETRRLWCR